MRKYIYHYYAIASLEQGKMMHSDGVVFTAKPVGSGCSLDSIRSFIADESASGLPAEKFTIASLTYLGREPWDSALRRGGIE